MRFDLVFEGGGAKGMVFVGALQAFEAAGHTPGRLLGTSAGAITATLMAAGYSAEELLAVISERDGERPVFATFMGLPDATEGDALRASDDAFDGIVVRLPAKGYGTTEFDMTDARRELLVAAGRDAMRAHLEALAEAPVSFSFDGDSDDARAERAADRLATRLLA